jgi:hypothetical protein
MLRVCSRKCQDIKTFSATLCSYKNYLEGQTLEGPLDGPQEQYFRNIDRTHLEGLLCVRQFEEALAKPEGMGVYRLDTGPSDFPLDGTMLP